MYMETKLPKLTAIGRVFRGSLNSQTLFLVIPTTFAGKIISAIYMSKKLGVVCFC